MPEYAKTTTVSTDKSRTEIERTLERYGATQFGYASDSIRNMASIQFTADERHIRFVLPLPSKDDDKFAKTTAKRRARTKDQALKLWEQACRQLWRALALCIKAKLEAIDAGISDFDSEFMAHIVLPDNRTVADLMKPQIIEAYALGHLPPGISALLPAPAKKGRKS